MSGDVEGIVFPETAPAILRDGLARGLNTAEIAQEIRERAQVPFTEAQVVGAIVDQAALSATMVPRKPVRKIIEEVAVSYGLTHQDLVGPSRQRDRVMARCEAIRKVGALWPHLSYPVIGRMFGGRDHTTIMHHFNKLGGDAACACDRHRKAVSNAQA